jgi:hypothetical protein
MLGRRNSSRSSSEPWRVKAGVAMSVWTPIAMVTEALRLAPSASQNATS